MGLCYHWQKKTLVTSFEELKKELENTIKKIHKET